ncbi:MAG: D-glycero-alpha-D-manno-heptose-1,7-bisphosphate 7-phosphatase [Bacteroidetes bacterium ADurb.Bin141]|nr:HAD family hydrolase [Bacteroidetes bacterium CHB6]OQB60285.1 MAG: D-glycero-alpha-D-manno-heptose-1,7-bisphosphate 7-phosphatase [Bacteroidetes bacterium ADurb.Bin141]
MHKAVFLDRDGVINRNNEYYTFKTNQVVINDGVVEALKHFSEKGFLLFVITNQSGVAKKLYTVDDVNAVHQYMQKVFNKAGVSITDFYFCPHHPDVSKCLCRKPDSLLIEKAAARYRVDLSKSFFIGDSSRDIEAAAKAGVKGFLINANESILPIAKKICAS